jgi:protein-disulfide isomerase
MNVEKWVDEKLAFLETGSGLLPDADSVLERLNGRERNLRHRRKRLLAIGVPCLIGCAAAATLISIPHEPGPLPPIHPAIASGDSAIASAPLATHDAISVNHSAKRPQPASPVRTNKVLTNKVLTNQVLTNSAPGMFKEIGSPSAPIGCEIYTDLECPPCAAFYRDTVPRLISEYVDSGKVRLLRRDFPLPQHRYARLAARYANAAGLIGKYDAVFNQLMATQSAWTQDGDLETPLAAVLSSEEMATVRKLVNEEQAPEELMLRDRAAGADDHVQQTPSIVIVAAGKRYTISGVVTFSAIKSYLDDILARQ